MHKKNVEFTWTLKQNKALTSKLVIKIFNPKKAVTLTTDASKYTIESHPIMYLSRKLSLAECNYSNIQKEA